MPGTKDAGPLCSILNGPAQQLADGTLCLCASPRPGAVGVEPGMFDHVSILEDPKDGQVFAQEAWFEQRYPNLLEDARLRFIAIVNNWVVNHWGDKTFQDQEQRIAVLGQNFYASPHPETAKQNAQIMADRALPLDPLSASRVKNMVPDNRFELCGDKPQSFHEADMVIGRFFIDLRTPFDITYLNPGSATETFEWSATMYVGDTMGVQAHDKAAHFPGVLTFAPSRKVTRGQWKIGGGGNKPGSPASSNGWAPFNSP
ncbi:hypothetical protein VVD49_13010 [Uliginosibacterium sp. H3]|uniref:Uncharacterized protein n=1 Tax=Uliginosibacterium silvisoli TaxID=3114758 RepID=A0ABU6K403_9RHOO|nr:hypothetical protein [Uliginosibacterium sp. H3]